MDINKILTEDDTNFLKALSYKLKTQDNHCTAKPLWRTPELEKLLEIIEKFLESEEL